MNRRFFLSAAGIAALALTGCAAPPHQRISLAPPAPLAETIPSAPFPDAYWIPGHWKWNGSAYVWAAGRWEQARPGMVYQLAYWSERGGEWIYHPGRWVSAEAPAIEPVPETVAVAPPPPQVEIVPAPPAPSQVWIAGHWRWHRGRYVWMPGYWTGVRPGYFWTPGHWVRRRSGWVFSGGYWQRY